MPFVVITLFFLWLTQTAQQPTVAEIPYTQFQTLVREGNVVEVMFRGERVDGVLRTEIALLADDGGLTKKFRTRIPAIGDDTLLPLLTENGVKISCQASAGGTRVGRRAPRSLTLVSHHRRLCLVYAPLFQKHAWGHGSLG